MTLDAAQFCLRAAAAAARIALAPNGAAAQTAEQFFKGKVINLYIGFAAGGTYDYYSRLFARFIGKHIPGNPTVVAQSMPGAGSFQAANFLYAVAPKDGTAMGMITQTAAIEEALQSPGVQYKAANSPGSAACRRSSNSISPGGRRMRRPSRTPCGTRFHSPAPARDRPPRPIRSCSTRSSAPGSR